MNGRAESPCIRGLMRQQPNRLSISHSHFLKSLQIIPFPRGTNRAASTMEPHSYKLAGDIPALVQAHENSPEDPDLQFKLLSRVEALHRKVQPSSYKTYRIMQITRGSRRCPPFSDIMSSNRYLRMASLVREN